MAPARERAACGGEREVAQRLEVERVTAQLVDEPEDAGEKGEFAHAGDLRLRGERVDERAYDHENEGAGDGGHGGQPPAGQCSNSV